MSFWGQLFFLFIDVILFCFVFPFVLQYSRFDSIRSMHADTKAISKTFVRSMDAELCEFPTKRNEYYFIFFFVLNFCSVSFFVVFRTEVGFFSFSFPLAYYHKDDCLFTHLLAYKVSAWKCSFLFLFSLLFNFVLYLIASTEMSLFLQFFFSCYSQTKSIFVYVQFYSSAYTNISVSLGSLCVCTCTCKTLCHVLQ